MCDRGSVLFHFRHCFIINVIPPLLFPPPPLLPPPLPPVPNDVCEIPEQAVMTTCANRVASSRGSFEPAPGSRIRGSFCARRNESERGLSDMSRFQIWRKQIPAEELYLPCSIVFAAPILSYLS